MSETDKFDELQAAFEAAERTPLIHGPWAMRLILGHYRDLDRRIAALEAQAGGLAHGEAPDPTTQEVRDAES